MSMEINTNLVTSILQRNLGAATKEINNSLVKLSYGRQVSAIEDAAGSMIAEQMESQARGAQEASQNTQQGLSMLQIADSDLGGINENLQRVRELTIQAANGTYSDTDKEAIKKEIQSLTDEIDRTAKASSFNDVKLLDGSSKDITLQIGGNSDPETNTLDAGNPLDAADAESLGLPEDLDSALSNPSEFLNSIDNAINTVSSRRSDIGAMENRLESTASSLDITSENLLASQSRIRDVDVAAEASKLTQNQILQNASVSLMAQANQNQGLANLILKQD